jgi:hypothetical protein
MKVMPRRCFKRRARDLGWGHKQWENVLITGTDEGIGDLSNLPVVSIKTDYFVPPKVYWHHSIHVAFRANRLGRAKERR